MKFKNILSAALLSTVFAGYAYAADFDGSVNDYGATSCPSLYKDNIAPEVSSNISDDAIEHCHTNNVNGYDNKYSFANLISSATRGPIYSAEFLTANNVNLSKGVSRKGITFFADPSIPAEYQGNVRDYVNSGYDRGHMANWANGANPQTFELSNIVPQDANNNRRLWEKIEVATRNIALNDESAYVITGPIYSNNPSHLKGTSNILVPDRLFKCISSVSYHGCYEVNNGPGWDYIKVSYKQIEVQSGVNSFPSDTANANTVNLPNPKNGRTEIVPVNGLSPYHAGTLGDNDVHVGRYEK